MTFPTRKPQYLTLCPLPAARDQRRVHPWSGVMCAPHEAAIPFPRTVCSTRATVLYSRCLNSWEEEQPSLLPLLGPARWL